MTKTDKQKQPAEELKELRAEYDQLIENNNALNERVLELYTLYNVSKTLSMSLQVTELFDLTMKVIGRALALDQYCLMLMDDNIGKLVIQASHGLPEEITAQHDGCAQDGVCWKVFESGKTLIINDISKETDFFYFPDSGLQEGSYLGVPLLQRDGRVIGLLNAHKPESQGFTDRDGRIHFRERTRQVTFTEHFHVHNGFIGFHRRNDVAPLYLVTKIFFPAYHHPFGHGVRKLRHFDYIRIRHKISI